MLREPPRKMAATTHERTRFIREPSILHCGTNRFYAHRSTWLDHKRSQNPCPGSFPSYIKFRTDKIAFRISRDPASGGHMEFSRSSRVAAVFAIVMLAMTAAASAQTT